METNVRERLCSIELVQGRVQWRNSFVKVRNFFYRLNEYDWIRPAGYLVEIFRMWSYK